MNSIKTQIRHWYLLWHYYKKEFFYFSLAPLAKALLPLLQLYFMARMIDLIVKGRIEDLPTWAIYTVLAIFSSQWIQVIAQGAVNYYTGKIYIKSQHIFSKKYREMDVKTAEDSGTMEALSNIRQNNNTFGFGIEHPLWMAERLIQGIVLIIGSLLLTISFFQQPVQKSEWAYLNGAWFDYGVIGICLCLTGINIYLSQKANDGFIKISDEFKLGNRVASYFQFRMAFQSERFLDSRIYEQDKIMEKTRHSYPFAKGNAFDRYKRQIHGKEVAISAMLSRIQFILIVLLVGAKAYAGAFSIGYLTRYIGSIHQFVIGFGLLAGVILEYRLNIPYAKKAMDFLDIRSDMYTGSLTTEKRTDRKYELEFRGVSFRYPGSENFVLHNLNLRFEIGKRLAIVGQNGSGKTTFIKLLLRFYDPDEGEIMLNGIDIRKYRYDDYLKIFSVVFQDFKLLAYPVGQNIAGSMHYDLEKLNRCIEAVGLTEKIAGWEKGLDTYLYTNVEEDGIEISGGEAQKIAIARALYRDAAFIILDEPTAALDPIAEAEIYERLGDIVSDRSAIFISHRLSSCKFADRILVFDEGRIVQIGSHAELYQGGGKYRQLWDAQARYYQE
ncbi:ABC transporter ATP-binding protein [Lachnospiraceae bacterium oral taxon 500]|nr:ABC transporter ATP-binding protein [Lachnospiraceae bacterium oral taxon 500]